MYYNDKSLQQNYVLNRKPHNEKKQLPDNLFFSMLEIVLPSLLWLQKQSILRIHNFHIAKSCCCCLVTMWSLLAVWGVVGNYVNNHVDLYPSPPHAPHPLNPTRHKQLGSTGISMYLNCLRRIYFSQNINDQTIFLTFLVYPFWKGDNDLKM